MNIENLRKLGKYLDGIVDDRDFTMMEFSNDMDFFKPPLDFNSLIALDPNSGDRASPIGHARALFPLELSDIRYEGFGGFVCHDLYSARVFDLKLGSDEWRFCFNADWAWIDDTRQGAINRIGLLINCAPKNAEPPTFEYLNRIYRQWRLNAQPNSPIFRAFYFK